MVDTSVLLQNSALSEQMKSGIIQRLEDQLRASFVSRFNIPANEVSVRMAEPDTDLGFADTQQITGALVADTETDLVDVDITNTQKIVGFYAINNLSADPSVNRIRFKTGATPGSGIKMSAYMEGLYAASEPKGWLEQPVIYVGERMLIRVEAFQTVNAPGERVILEALVAEKFGNVVSGGNV